MALDSLLPLASLYNLGFSNQILSSGKYKPAKGSCLAEN